MIKAVREREKLGLRGGGPAGTGGASEGEQQVLEGLHRQECIGVFSVHVHSR